MSIAGPVKVVWPPMQYNSPLSTTDPCHKDEVGIASWVVHFFEETLYDSFVVVEAELTFKPPAT